MFIDVYADLACPWCYIGGRRLEKALSQRPDLAVTRRWRPFQLRPEIPPEGLPWREFALEKFGGEENMEAVFASVSAAGAPDGVRFRFDRVASAPNTADAHRMILRAAHSGLGWEVAEALFEAYFSGGRDLNKREHLVEVGSGAGLDAEEIRTHLESEAGKEEVRRSQEEAYRLGIGGVPFYVFEGRYALPGAQPVEVFVRALDLVHAG